MPTRKMLVTWEDGADLSQSRKKPGDFSPLTRDGDNNLGHVTLSDADEYDYDWEPDSDPDPEAADLLGALVILGVIVAAQKAAPHLKRWWNESAVPLARRARKRLSRDGRSADQAIAAEPFTLVASAPTDSSQDVFVALDEYRATMSSAEARERFVAALVARLFSEEQLRVLRNARIEDDGPGLELVSAVETLTPQQLGESLRLMLEANPSWPDEETLAELEKILARSSEGDGEFVPVRRGRLNRPPRLPRRGDLLRPLSGEIDGLGERHQHSQERAARDAAHHPSHSG